MRLCARVGPENGHGTPCGESARMIVHLTFDRNDHKKCERSPFTSTCRTERALSSLYISVERDVVRVSACARRGRHRRRVRARAQASSATRERSIGRVDYSAHGTLGCGDASALVPARA